MNEQFSPDKVSRAVRGYFLAIRAMDADGFANTFAEHGTTFDPVGSPAITGRNGLREFFQSICKNFKTVSLTEDSVFVAGEGGAGEMARPRHRNKRPGGELRRGGGFRGKREGENSNCHPGFRT